MKYRKKLEIRAIKLHDISVTYEKWGGTQVGKLGDWLIESGDECYTCDADVFAETYAAAERDGYYYKTGTIDAEVQTTSGVIVTLEGESEYSVGDFIATNPGGDQYVISKEVFEATYTEA